MKRILLMCICLCLMLPAGMLAQENIVLYVNGEPITQSQLDERMKNTRQIDAQASGKLSQEEIAAREEAARKQALTALAAETALLQEAENRGLTMADATVKASADQRYEKMLASVESYVLSAYPSLSGEALDAQVDQMLASTGSSREAYREIAQRNAVLAALNEALMQEMPPVSEDDIAARYEQLLAEQRERFADENAFEAAMLAGETIVHRPVALKLIQKAEFLFESGAMTLIAQTAAVNEENAQAMRADQLAKAEGRAKAALAALESGEKTFGEIMETCKAGSSGAVNYFNEKSTRFAKDYYERAAAFETVGEISTPYAMTNGYALLHFAGTLPACEQVSLDEVRDSISAQLAGEMERAWLAEAQSAILSAAVIEGAE